MENNAGDLFRRTVQDINKYVNEFENKESAYKSPDALWRVICEMPGSAEEIKYRERVKHELICAVHKANLEQLEAQRVEEINDIKIKIAHAMQLRKEVGRKKVIAEQMEIEAQIKLDIAKQDKLRGQQIVEEASANILAVNERLQNLTAHN